MIVVTNTDILFDDVSMLKQVIGQNALTLSAPASDCDCISYSSPTIDEDADTAKIAQPARQAN